MSGKKKKRVNSVKKVTALKSQLKPAKKRAQKKTQKHGLDINGTKAVGVLAVLVILALQHSTCLTVVN